MESNHLQQCHKLRAMLFAFRHIVWSPDQDSNLLPNAEEARFYYMSYDGIL